MVRLAIHLSREFVHSSKSKQRRSDVHVGSRVGEGGAGSDAGAALGTVAKATRVSRGQAQEEEEQERNTSSRSSSLRATEL